jgi:hypothetical protein
MKVQMTQKNILFLSIGLILFAALTRLLPHPVNFTAIGAMALFAGVTFRKHKWAYLLPFIALFMTDLVLGLHFSILAVYGCFAFTVWLGTRANGQVKAVNIGILSITSSSVFFLVTNLPFWYADLSLYPLSIEGTLQSYTMALPFFKNQILADLFYNGLFFGIYHFATKRSKISIA